MKYIVYVDLLFGMNFILDLYILYLTAKLSKKRICWWRICIGAMVASVGSIFILYSEFALIRIWKMTIVLLLAKLCEIIAVGVVMDLIAYDIRRFRELIFVFGVQLLVSFVLGGMLVACYQLPGVRSMMSAIENGQKRIVFFMLIFLLGISTLLFIEEGYKRYQHTNAIEKYVSILWFGDRTNRTEGFVDTGNRLLEPLSQQPVVIADGAWLMRMLPENYNCLVEKYLENGCIDDAWIMKKELYLAKWIPYKTIGEEAGTMLGIQCTKLILYGDNHYRVIQPVIVAVSHTKIETGDGCCLILPQAYV